MNKSKKEEKFIRELDSIKQMDYSELMDLPVESYLCEGKKSG